MVSIHDVAPATHRECAALVDALADAAIPLTQLVIAGPWRGEGLVGGDGRATEVLGWLRQRRDAGDEVSLHGWLHRADHSTSTLRRLVGNIAARGVGELWELDRQTTAQRASLGLDLLRRNGLNAIGCTPPGWLVSRQARLGLAEGTYADVLADLRAGG
ncbi:MAG: DUF2334 domain-containing protein [Kineosporiaceae bacterium]